MKSVSTIAPAIFLAIALMVVASVATAEEDGSRNKKIFSFLNLVRFENTVCAGASQNGTCYLADECTQRGGVASGSCGGDYGVCCVITLSCGGESRDNNTNIMQSAKTTFTAQERNCDYRICPVADTIRRIRFDFQTLVLAGPAAATATAATAANAAYNFAVGRCLTDSFSITGSPEICGTNSGEHMIVDSDGMNCAVAMFMIGAATTVSRSWTIVATQYAAGQEDMSSAGPAGCLQYFTAATGSIRSFNFPTTAPVTTAITAGATHLAQQRYEICIRRAAMNCRICYFPADDVGGMLAMGMMNSQNDQASFGVSVTAAAGSMSNIDTACSSDYLTIPNGSSMTGLATAGSANRFCGRFFNTDQVSVVHATICTSSLPFTVGVQFDPMEVAVGTDQTDSEDAFPSGSIGFFLFYQQFRSCTTGP